MAKTKRKGRKKARSYISNPKPKSKGRTFFHAAKRSSQKASAAGRVLRSYRRNPAPVLMETGLLLGGAVAGAILVPKAVSFIPVGSNLVKNIGMGVGGAGLAFLGHKKRSHLLLGIGLGTALAGVTRAVTNAVPALAGAGEYSQDEQHLINADLSGDDSETYLGAPAMMGAIFTNTMF